MADTVLSQCINAIVQAVKDLDLTDMPDSNVTRKVVLLDRDHVFPEIRVLPWGAETESVEGGTNIRDDWAYPILVCIIDRTTNVTNGEKQFKWRQRIRKRFHYQALNVAEVVKKTKCTPLTIVDREAWRDETMFLSALLVQPTTREDRDYTVV